MPLLHNLARVLFPLVDLANAPSLRGIRLQRQIVGALRIAEAMQLGCSPERVALGWPKKGRTKPVENQFRRAAFAVAETRKPRRDSYYWKMLKSAPGALWAGPALFVGAFLTGQPPVDRPFCL